MRVTLIFVLLLIGITSSVQAKRIALVIGNDDYLNVTKLQKAVNDANAMASTLKDLKFIVIKKTDVDRTSMISLLGRIAAEIQVGDEVLFYFSGHGVSVDGQNYLLPTDIPKIVPSLKYSLPKEAFSEEEIINILQKNGARVSILIIDACRNNPFPKDGKKSVGRSVGLERISAPKGTFILYSAGIGQEALDRLGKEDKNPNSVFTRKLLPLLRRPSLSISNMAKGLRVEVEDLALKATPPHQNHKQFPAYYDQLRGRFYFLPSKKNLENAIGNTSIGAEETLWKEIENSKKISDFDFYLKEYPKGRYSSVAQLKIKRLKETKVAVGINPDKKPLIRSYKPGDTFKDCNDCPEMVVVPPGEFIMGSSNSEKERSISEGPIHKVTIAKKFAVGKFEVTRAQFVTFVNETGYSGGKKCYAYGEAPWALLSGKSYNNPGFKQDDTHPVVCIRWVDAKAYIRWLKRKTNQDYRLLSEAEWEYVARANTDTPFWWGKSISTEQANYDGNYTYNGSKGKYRNKTVPVDSFEPNSFGLYNVHGNVLEWVEDCVHNSYHGAPKDGSPWIKEGDNGWCNQRILRGGSWRSAPEGLRAATRFWPSSQELSLIYHGFRVAKTLNN